MNSAVNIGRAIQLSSHNLPCCCVLSSFHMRSAKWRLAVPPFPKLRWLSREAIYGEQAFCANDSSKLEYPRKDQSTDQERWMECMTALSPITSVSASSSQWHRSFAVVDTSLGRCLQVIVSANRKVFL